MKTIPYPKRREPTAEESIALQKIQKKYSLPPIVEELCFAFILDKLISKIPSPNLVVDVGCGHFRYQQALFKVIKSKSPNAKIIAVDKKITPPPGPADFIKGEIEKLNLGKVDLLTVFNPFPEIPDIKRHKADFLIGCVDWNKENFMKSLDENGFEPILWLDNPFKELIVAWYNKYDPFVVAKAKAFKKTA